MKSNVIGQILPTGDLPQHRIRLRPRRLFQGCAFLLLFPTAAAFLPVQGRAPQRTTSLLPVDPVPTPIHLSSPVKPIHLSAALAGNSAPVAHASARPSFVARLPFASHLPFVAHSVASASAPVAVAPSAPKSSRLAGLASWYGSVLHGHRTASGELFDSNALTACHKTLPFGTLVRVINLLNNRSVLVRINDRGVLRSDRVIDLSSAAAERLDMIRAGVAPVRLEIEKTMGLARGPEPGRSGMPNSQAMSVESR